MMFNINNYVKVKLTPYGVSLLKIEHDRIQGYYDEQERTEFKIKLEDDGKYKEQLWVIMNKLGSNFMNGSKQIIEGNIMEMLEHS